MHVLHYESFTGGGDKVKIAVCDDEKNALEHIAAQVASIIPDCDVTTFLYAAEMMEIIKDGARFDAVLCGWHSFFHIVRTYCYILSRTDRRQFCPLPSLPLLFRHSERMRLQKGFLDSGRIDEET